MILSSAGAIDSSPFSARSLDEVACAARCARRSAADKDCLATVMPHDPVSEREMQAAEAGGEDELLRRRREGETECAEPEECASHDRNRAHRESAARRHRRAVEREPRAREERSLSRREERDGEDGARDERRREREGEAACRSVQERLTGAGSLAANGAP